VAEGESFDLGLSELLDEYYASGPEGRRRMIEEEPEALSEVENAYLAAVAEHLAYHSGLQPPEWVFSEKRFLKQPFFAARVEGLNPLLLKESPTAFRRRMIFVSGNALSRA